MYYERTLSTAKIELRSPPELSLFIWIWDNLAYIAKKIFKSQHRDVFIIKLYEKLKGLIMKKYFSSIFILLLALSFQLKAGAVSVLQEQGLIGSVWTGEGQSGIGLITYTFHFNQDGLFLESTCHIDEISSTLKSDLAASYSANGNSVELKSGLQSTIPSGKGSCMVNFPAGLKFELDQTQIYIEYNGDRRLTHLKRKN